jgi:hypothetical protein
LRIADIRPIRASTYRRLRLSAGELQHRYRSMARCVPGYFLPTAPSLTDRASRLNIQ